MWIASAVNAIALSEVIDPYQVWVKGEGGWAPELSKSSDSTRVQLGIGQSIKFSNMGENCKWTVHPIRVTLFWPDLYYHVWEVYYCYHRICSCSRNQSYSTVTSQEVGSTAGLICQKLIVKILKELAAAAAAAAIWTTLPQRCPPNISCFPHGFKIILISQNIKILLSRYQNTHI